MKTNDPSVLWELANAIACVLVAGYQTPVTIEPMGRTFDTNRRVRVSRPWAPQDEHENDEIHPDDVWEGPVEDWCAAVKEATNRDDFWRTMQAIGPYERAARGVR